MPLMIKVLSTLNCFSLLKDHSREIYYAQDVLNVELPFLVTQ